MNVARKPGYKETAAGWIPLDWGLSQLRDTGEILSGSTPATTVDEYWDGGIPWCTPTDITRLCGQRVLKSTERSISAEGLKNSGAVMIKPNSVLVCTRATVGVCAINTEPITTNQGFKSIVPNEDFTPDYLYFAITNLQPELKKKASGSTFLEINKTEFEKILVCHPPLPEQKKIAAILTAVDDKLDVIARQIEATQTLKRGLLKTLLSQGVGTQDADSHWMPHTDFKDSELGEIPVGWEVKALDTLADSISVGIASSTTEHYVDEGVPLIRNQNIKEDFLDMSDLLKISVAFDAKNRNKRVQDGDILTVRTGYPGVSCVVPAGLGYLQTFTTLITRPNKKLIIPDFASRYFNSPQGKELMLHQAAGGAQQNINAGNLKKLLVPVPSLAEQGRIVEILSAVDAKGRSLVSKNRHYQTVKRGLMQKLLTGEWRVNVETAITEVKAEAEVTA
ncbi:Type I restriction modification DNA specificity domain protein [compost metagenome]